MTVAVQVLLLAVFADADVAVQDASLFQVRTDKVPQPYCVGERGSFDTGFGGCHHYVSQRNNFRFCDEDFDGHQGYSPSQVCSECKACRDANSTLAEQLESTKQVEELEQANGQDEQEASKLQQKVKEAERKAEEAQAAARKAVREAAEAKRQVAASKAMETEAADRKAKEVQAAWEKAQKRQRDIKGDIGKLEAELKAKMQADERKAKEVQAAWEEAQEPQRDMKDDIGKLEAEPKAKMQADERKAKEEQAERQKLEEALEAERKAKAAQDLENMRKAEEAKRKMQENAQEAERKAEEAKRQEAERKAEEAKRQAQAVGDPHLVNMYGQRFDILQEGTHVLLLIPNRGRGTQVFLNVVAEAWRSGVACSDLYFKTMNVTGKWVEEIHQGGLQYFASRPSSDTSNTWMHFRHVDLKIRWGHTGDGIEYLNLFVRHLGMAEYPVGGLLGEDDHTAIATRTEGCRSTLALAHHRASLEQTLYKGETMAEAGY